jgi:hypothetical protein
MPRLTSVVSFLSCGLALVAAAAAATPPAGYISLFNGRDLAGWRGGTTYDHRQLLELPAAEREALLAKWTASLTELKDGKPHWRVEQGELVNDGVGGYATTAKDYGDFELHLEFKLAKGCDSGIYLRGVPQIQLWDPTMPDPKGHGYAQGFRRPLEQRQGHARPRPAGQGRQAGRRMERSPRRHGGAAASVSG